MKRIALFLSTNLAIVLVLSLSARLLGLEPYLSAQGLDLGALLAFAASLTQETGQFALVQRFIFTPLFLFSGTFYPLSTLPEWLQPIGWVSPVWHGAELGRVLSYGAPMSGALVLAHVLVLVAMAAIGGYLAARHFVRRLR